MENNRRQERKRNRRTSVRQNKRRAKGASSRRGSDAKHRRSGGRITPAIPTFQADSAERAAESAADRMVAWIGENDPPLPDDALTGRPDDPSRLVPRTPSHARIVHWDRDANANPVVDAHYAVLASWKRAVRDGLVSAYDLVRANLLGHRLYYLGCLAGDIADLAALKGCFEYHLAAYYRESLSAQSRENLIVVGDGSRRWFFCGSPVESPEEQKEWVCCMGRVLALMNADWVMTYRGGEVKDEDGKLRDAVAAQIVIPRLLACHALLRTASGESCGERRTLVLDDVSNMLRFVACLSALAATAATWMESADADIPALDAVAARARRSLGKFDQLGEKTDWLDPVSMDEETWQDVAPCIRGLAAIWSGGGGMRDVG